MTDTEVGSPRCPSTIVSLCRGNSNRKRNCAHEVPRAVLARRCNERINDRSCRYRYRCRCSCRGNRHREVLRDIHRLAVAPAPTRQIRDHTLDVELGHILPCADLGHLNEGDGWGKYGDILFADLATKFLRYIQLHEVR